MAPIRAHGVLNLLLLAVGGIFGFFLTPAVVGHLFGDTTQRVELEDGYELVPADSPQNYSETGKDTYGSNLLDVYTGMVSLDVPADVSVRFKLEEGDEVSLTEIGAIEVFAGDISYIVSRTASKDHFAHATVALPGAEPINEAIEYYDFGMDGLVDARLFRSSQSGPADYQIRMHSQWLPAQYDGERDKTYLLDAEHRIPLEFRDGEWHRMEV